MARTPNRRQVLATIGAGTLATVAGCSGGSDGRTVQLGVIGPQTGDLSSVGVPIINAGELPATRLQNADVSINFDVSTEDTETDPVTGVSAANSLVNQGYPMVTGALASNVTREIAREVFIPGEVTMCSPASTARTLTELDDNGFFFRTAPSDQLQGKLLAEVAQTRLEATTASTLYLNDAYGQAIEGIFADAFTDLGGEIFERVSFEPQQASYVSRLQTVLEPDPDMLLLIGFPDTGIDLFNDFYSEFDTDIDILVSDGLIDRTLPNDVGNNLPNVIGTVPSANGPHVDAFTTQYESEYDAAPGPFNAHAYDASAALILANVAAGENSGPAVRDQMRAVTSGEGSTYGPDELVDAVQAVSEGEAVVYEGASSTVQFDENGDISASTYDIRRYGADGLTTVAAQEVTRN